MMRSALDGLVILSALGLATAVGAQTPSAPSPDQAKTSGQSTPRVRVVGLRVTDPSVSQADFDRAPLPAVRGTSVRLLVTGFAHPVVAVDRQGSQVHRFVDSTGRDLLGGEPPRGEAGAGGASSGRAQGLGLREGPAIEPGPAISRDGQKVLVALRAPRRPAAKASAVRLKANLKMRVGIGQRTKTVKDVAIKEGATLIQDDEDRGVSIARVGPSNWGKQPQHVHLKLSGQRATRFVQARFIDAQGNDVTARQMAPMHMAETIQVPVALKEKLDRATVRLTFYEAIEPRTVPVTLRAGLGLDRGDSRGASNRAARGE